MADQDSREPELSLVLGDHAQNCIFSDRILSGCGFIKEDNLRIGYQSPCEGYSLLHAPGKFRRELLGCVSEFHLFHPGRHHPVNFSLFQACRFPEGQSDIFMDSHGIEQGVVLKHVTHFSKGVGHLTLSYIDNRFSPEKNGPLVGFKQPDDMFKEDAFAATAETDDRRNLSLIYLQIHMLKDRFGSEALGDVLEFN